MSDPPPSGPSSGSPSLLRFVLLVGAIVACPAVSMDIYLPAIPTITAALGGSAQDGRLTVTLFFLGFAAGQVVWGTAADAFGRRPVLLAGLGVYVLASLATTFSPDMEALLAARMLQGMGAGAGAVLGRILVRDRYEGAEMARVMSYVMSILILGPIIAPVVGALLLEWLDWRAIFGFVAGYGALIFLLVLAVLSETHAGRGVSALRPGHLLQSYRVVLAHRRTRIFVAVNTLGYASLLIYLSTVSMVVIEHWGWTPTEMSLLFAGVAGCIAVGGLANARLLRRLRVERMLAAGLVLGLAGGVSGTAASLALPGFHAPAVAAFGLAMLGFSLVVANSTALAVQAHGARAGIATAVLGVLQTLGASALGIALSFVHDGTAVPTFLAFAALNLAAFAVLRTDRKEDRPA